TFLPLFSVILRRPPTPTLFPYTTLFRSFPLCNCLVQISAINPNASEPRWPDRRQVARCDQIAQRPRADAAVDLGCPQIEQTARRSEEHTSELQSRVDLVCRLLLEKNNRI